jgi:hypothetical protein
MKNQPPDDTAPFTAPEVAEAFHVKTQGWTTSKGKPITPEQREDLIQKYLKKEREGEYLTKLGEKGPVRTGAVAKACITMNINGRPFVLVRPPSATHLRNWKLPGGKQSTQDRIDPSSDLYLALSRSVGGRFAENWDVIVPLLMTTLRELNEELPLPAHINLGSGKAVAFVNGKAELITTDQLPHQQRFVRINPQGVEWHRNRNKEPEGKERYPGITRDSTLMFVHAELVDLHASMSVGEPIVLRDDSGTCRWIPLTPSTVHWLSKQPLYILPEHMLSEMLSLPSGPISNLHAHHINSLIESYLSPTSDGGNHVSLDKILEKKIDQLPEEDREDLASGSNKKSFNRVSKKDKKERDKVGKLNLAKNYRLLDSPGSGFAVVHKNMPETSHPMHMRADQLLLFRAAGKWWKKGMLPHNIRYQQEKRAKRATLLHEFKALYISARNKDIENEKKDLEKVYQNAELRKKLKEFMDKTDEEGIKQLAYRLATPSDGDENEEEAATLFELPTHQSGKIVKTPVRRFTDITPDMLIRYIEAWPLTKNANGDDVSPAVVEFARKHSGALSWKNLMMRTDAAWNIMNQTGCPHCNVPAGEPCHTTNIGLMISEPRTYNHIKLPRYQPNKEHTTRALADHLLRDFAWMMGGQYALPMRDMWNTEVTLGILSGNVSSFEDKHLSDEFRAKRPAEAIPILPFACKRRFEAACQPGVEWKEMIQGHLSPLERVAKTGKKSKGGQVKLYLSGKETEPPILMQNLVADVIKREHALMRSVHWKRLSLPDGRPRWNERLLWEFITPTPRGTLTTLPLDAPIEAWPGDERRIPLLNFIGADHGKEKGKRFNREGKHIAARPGHRLAPSSEDWLWTREATDQPLEGLLPIVTPDVSMGELLDLAAMNGIGVAVAIDAWSANGLPETGDMFGPADTEWYISSDLFGKNEPPAYRTYGSFLGALNANKQLDIEVDQVKHERRIFGVLLLDELLNMQCNL